MTIEEKCMLQRIRTFHGFKGVHDYVAMMQIIIGVEDCFVQNDRSRHDRPNRQAVVTDDNLNNPYFCSITVIPSKAKSLKGHCETIAVFI